MGRFDVQKQNTYLHAGLHCKLQEENIDLAARLEKHVKQAPRLSLEIAGGRQGISGRSTLCDIEEESNAEEWTEEKLELETSSR